MGYLTQTLSTTGPVMHSQSGACQLAQSIQDAWTKVNPICPMEIEEEFFKVVGKSLMALVTKVNTGLALLNPFFPTYAFVMFTHCV